MPDGRESGADRARGGRVRRVVFRLVMATLILLLAGRTYEETAVALARSHGSLDTSAATVTELTSHTVSGYAGGGQDGGDGEYFVHTDYTVRLALPEGHKTVDKVQDMDAGEIWQGKRVTVGLWHGRVVEIDGHDVWRGWHFGLLDVTLIVLMPVITGYLVGLAVLAAALLAARSGRVRLGRDDRFAPCALGWVTGMAALLALLVNTAFGNVLPYWPAVPVGLATAVALVALGAVIRRRGRPRSQDTGVAADDASAPA